MEKLFIDQLAMYGLPGLGCLALAWALLKKDAKVDEIQEKRIAEAKESTAAIQQNTNTLETLTNVLTEKKGA